VVQPLSGHGYARAIPVSHGAFGRTEAVIDFLEVAGLLTTSV